MFSRATGSIASKSNMLSASFSASAQRFASTLVLVEHDGSDIATGTLSAVTAAKQLGGDITALVAGKGADAVAEKAGKVDGVAKVLVADADFYENPVAEDISNLVLKVQESGNFSHIVAGSSALSKGALPRVAAKLDVSAISEVIEVQGEDTFVRPIYAGNALATVKSTDGVKVMTVRPTAFSEAAAEGGSAAVDKVDAGAKFEGTTWKANMLSDSDRPDLQTAKIVVAGGRGMKDGANFELLYKLAEKMDAAVGASRAAVDAEWVPNDMQVGQTGKIIAPDLYIGAGISGAIQHLAGMKDSKVIVCINKDEEAPLFAVADYGLVADLFDAIPEMTEKLSK